MKDELLEDELLESESMKDKLRVALFTDADVFAGTERHMLDLACGLRAEGAEVLLACPMPSPLAEKADGAGLAVVPIQKKGLVDWAAVRTLRGLLRAGKVQIVHAHNGRTALASALAVTMAGRGVAVATQHFLEPNHVTQGGAKGRLSHAAHRWVSQRTTRFIAISEAVRREMEGRGEAPEGKVVVVPNGLAPPEPSRQTSRAEVRAALGLGADVPLLVCAARLEREKDVASLVEAMGHVRADFPAAVCVVAGEGTLRPALAAQIRDGGMESRVRLLGYRADVLSLINAGDLFVLPSLAEPFGLVLLEAMALGKPVIATAAGGPLEIVVPDETGVLVPPGQPEALARAITQMLARPREMEALGISARRRFCERFTAARMARDTVAVYQGALRQHALGQRGMGPRALGRRAA